MAPPRQRGPAATNLDDSRSEASSGQRERQFGASKGRRGGNTATATSKDAKPPHPAVVLAGEAEQTTTEHPAINWSTMPLSVLHQYRYVHNLPCPSAFSSQINSILLSRGIGLRSPTAIAARNAQRAANRTPQSSSSSSKRAKEATSGTQDGVGLHPVSQARVSKDHLASAVRKHFNNTAISEQDAIARSLRAPSRKAMVVQFCEDCGNLLDDIPDELLRYTALNYTQTSTSENFPSRLRNKLKSYTQEVTREAVGSGPQIEMDCVKCPSREVTYAQVQLRSADEGSTIFYTCMKCKHRKTTKQTDLDCLDSGRDKTIYWLEPS
ncbi:predicted protein [Uncinocarpus reesii 1704]|uniref:DNA-directed RNA polymerase I subunit RPA12 n=1 Tax=Uncinocarpus reesii (strain UAMH 1704) TaxID=336963 RepID=C4JFT0_UNCRE|nr:uncharacterized protein UREG_02414 [Uncinocarpus reesii 1704]EEP77565.1 predicted protein [Uncinocarpus reesii 1704]